MVKNAQNKIHNILILKTSIPLSIPRLFAILPYYSGEFFSPCKRTQKQGLPAYFRIVYEHFLAKYFDYHTRQKLPIVTSNTLRLLLSPYFAEEELKQWFDPLSVQGDSAGKTLSVTFPHVFFERWFFENIRPVFEKAFFSVPELSSLHIIYKNKDGIQEKFYAKDKYLIEEHTEYESNTLQSAYKVHNQSGFESRVAIKAHTFASFLSNRKNDFPLAAAQQIASIIPSNPHNPFVIYGQSGCGKTHLIGAIINRVTETCADVPFFYGGPEHISHFYENMHNAVQYKAFFLDDMQNLAQSTELQNRFMFFFDAAVSRNALVTVCLEGHPLGHNGLLQKIRTRLTSGLVVEVKKPDLDIRYRFIQKLVTEQALPISKEEALALAQRYTDFRTIEGTLIKVKVYQSLIKDGNNDLSVILGAQADQKTVTAQSIIKNVAEFYHVPAEEIIGKSRKRDHTRARNTAIFLCRELLGVSLSQVGEFFGSRDHSSILYTIKKMQELKRSDTDTNNELSKLKKMCLSL